LVVDGDGDGDGDGELETDPAGELVLVPVLGAGFGFGAELRPERGAEAPRDPRACEAAPGLLSALEPDGPPRSFAGTAWPVDLRAACEPAGWWVVGATGPRSAGAR
jgi:hypothetical protein